MDEGQKKKGGAGTNQDCSARVVPTSSHGAQEIQDAVSLTRHIHILLKLDNIISIYTLPYVLYFFLLRNIVDRTFMYPSHEHENGNICTISIKFLVHSSKNNPVSKAFGSRKCSRKGSFHGYLRRAAWTVLLPLRPQMHTVS